MEKTLRDRYKVTDVLGQGAMGVVYRAQDLQLDRTVALKSLAPDLLASEEAMAIFRTEARVMARLKHPNLLGVYDVFEESDETYLVMEYVDGDTVEHLIESSSTAQLPIEDAIDIATQLLVALTYIEEHNVVHRDIKPSNLMMERSGTLKLMDFGLARDMDRLLQKGTRVRGTPAYMSPEQVTGELLSPASDLYSTGATLFEVFTGRLPFESGELAFHQVFTKAPDPRDLRVDIPETMADMIVRCMAKDPADRPSSAQQLLMEVIDGLGERERPYPPSVRSQLELSSFPSGSMHTRAMAETQDGLAIASPPREDPRVARLRVGVGVVAGVLLALLVTLASLLLFRGPEAADEGAGGAPVKAAVTVSANPGEPEPTPSAEPLEPEKRQADVAPAATAEARDDLNAALLKASGAASAAAETDPPPADEEAGGEATDDTAPTATAEDDKDPNPAARLAAQRAAAERRAKEAAAKKAEEAAAKKAEEAAAKKAAEDAAAKKAEEERAEAARREAEVAAAKKAAEEAAAKKAREEAAAKKAREEAAKKVAQPGSGPTTARADTKTNSKAPDKEPKGDGKVPVPLGF